MSSAPPLLEAVRGLLERTYRMDCGLGRLGAFVIGDEGYRRIYAGKRVHRNVSSELMPDAQLLVRETDAEVLARIYFPDALIQRLEQYPPQRGLDASNVDDFAVFVEEIDHLLFLAERTRQRRPLSLFEMELHANVSKYLVLSRFLAGRASGLDAGQRLWLRQQLFGGEAFQEQNASLRRRYSDALRWGVKFLDRLLGRAAAQRLDFLRRFHDAETREKLRLIDSVA